MYGALSFWEAEWPLVLQTYSNLIDTSNKAKKTFANSFYISAVPHSCKIVFDSPLEPFDHLLHRGPNPLPVHWPGWQKSFLSLS